MTAFRARRVSALVASWLAFWTAPLAQSDWRSGLSSPRAADRETALLQLGDAGLTEAADLRAVARLLRDPVAAVRWNAIAALRKAGPAATPVLLAQLADPRVSQHIGSYFSGCGRTLFVPTEGELAAAALAASPEVDGDLVWKRFAEGDGNDTTRLLRSVIDASQIPPPAALLSIAHRVRDDARSLMARLATANDPKTANALSTALDAAGINRRAAFDRDIAEALARAGPAGRSAAAKGLATSPFPEEWLPAAAGRAGNTAQAVRAFETAALSGRPEALRSISRTISAISLYDRQPETVARTWLSRVSPSAMHAFLAQPLGNSDAEKATFVSAVRRIIPLATWRAATTALLGRLIEASERDPTWNPPVLHGLADDSHIVAYAAELRQVWSEVRRRLGAPGVRGDFLVTLVSRLPPPSPGARPELARLLVAAMLEGRLSPRAFAAIDQPGNYPERPPPSTPETIAWHSAMRRAVPTEVPGGEWIRAKLLAALGADSEQMLQAWRAVETSGTATPAQAAEALEYLLRRESTRAWAETRLMQRLTESTDRAVAFIYTNRVWGQTFRYWSISSNETGLFSGPPGGFALVARLERIDVTGRPFPGLARWTTDGQPKLDLGDLLGDLFLERPGYFRTVVFVVTDQPVFQADSKARLPDVLEGGQVMPPQLSEMRLDGKYLMALVYSFERRQGESMRAWVEGSPSALHHLRAAGIWQRLSRRP
jgi:hypothetical protein